MWSLPTPMSKASWPLLPSLREGRPGTSFFVSSIFPTRCRERHPLVTAFRGLGLPLTVRQCSPALTKESGPLPGGATSMAVATRA